MRESGDAAAQEPAHTRASAEALLAWRYWQLTSGRRLRSVSQRRYVWPPGEIMGAACVGGGHTPPAAGCGCGLYGARDLQTLRAQRLCIDADPLVVGRVTLWGRMVSDGAGGYRAQYASPRMLSLVDETVPDGSHAGILAGLSAYGVPLGTAPLGEVVDEVSASAIAYEAMARGTAGR